MYKIFYFSVIALLVASCEKDVEAPSPKSGEADFSVFVSLGDSYTAGYINGALSRDGQMSSFAKLMADNLTALSNDSYSVPFLPEDMSVGASLEGKMALQITEAGLTPVTTSGNPELLTDVSTWVNSEGPFHNLGIPGARSFHLITPEYGDPTQGAGNFNPFFARFASVPGGSTALSDALAVNPTFFSLWIGGNDVLGYALQGGGGEVSGMTDADLTPVEVFAQSFNYILSQLTANGAGGVVATIPDIDQLPFFNVVLPNMLSLSDEQAAALNVGYEEYNAAAVQYELDEISFAEGNNYFVIEDKNHLLGMRQIQAGEKLLLTCRTNITEAGWGSKVPIPEKYVLDLSELEAISNAKTAFNTIIQNSASLYNLAMVDTDDLFASTTEGLIIDGNTYSNAYITGGVFSLDGIHATGRGSAIIANAFIDAVNEQYGSSVPHILVNDQMGIVFP